MHTFEDVSAIVEVLASQPPPDQVLALRPSPTLQARVTSLLDQSKDGALSPQEEMELERFPFDRQYLTLRCCVRTKEFHCLPAPGVELDAATPAANRPSYSWGMLLKPSWV